MQIMALSAPAGEEAACYIRFLQQVLPSFLRVTRRLEELQARVQALWPSYNAPLRAGTVQPQEAARLWQLFLPHLHRSCGPSAASRCAPPPPPFAVVPHAYATWIQIRPCVAKATYSCRRPLCESSFLGASLAVRMTP